jgi:integrase
MALTFVRTGELIGARWQEFDLATAQWRIPAERTKSRREHLVPLAPQALEVLRTLQAVHGHDPARCTGAALLFPGERKRSTPMSNNTMLKALEGVASTALNEMGYRPDVIEAQLAHVEENRVRAAYNHARYSAERVALMKDWANYCDAVRQGGSVIPLRAAAAQSAA